ncbi:hypothetical protein [Streptomyces hoynatensis]|uniref:hypothetical protein n=1 Tax=Streptomyces hoynatensis TaxID=1141874 RepID=UPI0011C41E65|nr:hypothetical protein [Streptomyces hoynatensis]
MAERDEVLHILQRAYPEERYADSVSYAGELGDPVQALMYSTFFWPKLLEIEGAVFVALWGEDEKNISERIYVPTRSESAPLTWKQAVDSFNIFETMYLFRQSRGSFDLSQDAAWELAQVLVETWGWRLKSEYPQRSFEVCLNESGDALGSHIQVVQTYPQLAVPSRWCPTRHAILGDAEGDVVEDINPKR